MADVRLPTLNCRDPMAVGPRWIMPDVLLVTALQISNPIQFFIQMKPDNFPRLTFKLSLPLHDALPGLARTDFRVSRAAFAYPMSAGATTPPLRMIAKWLYDANHTPRKAVVNS